jgi:signal transduction histidine kinase
MKVVSVVVGLVVVQLLFSFGQVNGANCTASCKSACSYRTAQNLLIKTYNALQEASTPGQLMRVWDAITYGSDYTAPGGFYAFVFDYADHAKAVAGNPTWVGIELKDILAKNNFVSNLNLGAVLRGAANATGGSWAEYQWRNSPVEPVLPYRSFLRHFNKFLTDYYVGVGFVDTACSSSGVETCSRFCFSPCAVDNTKNIVDKLVFDLINACNTKEVEEILGNVTFGSRYSVQSGFYSFVNLMAGPTVAHGLHPEYVSLTLAEIADQLGFYDQIPMNLHEMFTQVAKRGGGWLRYKWSDVGLPLDEHVAYVAPATAVGTEYYVAAAFVNAPCAKCPCNCNCPQVHCEPCEVEREEVVSQIRFKFRNIACVGDKC